MITAYDTEDNESGFSNEVFFQPSTPTSLTNLSISGDDFVNENNSAGFVATVGTAGILSAYKLLRKERDCIRAKHEIGRAQEDYTWKAAYLIVGLYFVFIILLCYAMQNIINLT